MALLTLTSNRVAAARALPPSGNHAVILPISGKKLRSITAGTRCMDAGFDVSMSSGAPAVKLFMSRWRPATLSVVAAWMLDPAACAGMELGTPRVTIAALAELHQLLIEHGFRRSSSGGSTIVREKRDENPADINAVIGSPAPAQHAVRFGKAARHDPGGAPQISLARLASLLLEAAGVDRRGE